MSTPQRPALHRMLAMALLFAFAMSPAIATAQDQESGDVEMEADEVVEDDVSEPDDADMEADAEPEQELEADAEPEQEMEAEVDAEPEQEMEVEAEADVEPEQEMEAEAETASETDAGMPADADAGDFATPEIGDDTAPQQAFDSGEDRALAIDDVADDSWADAWTDEVTERDDVIPIDHGRFGNAEVWQVVETMEATGPGRDSFAAGMPVIRTSRRVASGTGRTPPRMPGDNPDTVYSYGGLPVAATSVPWQAQITYPNAPPRNAKDTRPAWQRQHYCGGALIAPDWVVSAAHCIDQLEVDVGFKVRLGAQDISKGDGVLFKIDRIVRHSQYNGESQDVNNPPNMYANDIVLVHIVADGKPVPIDSRLVRQIPINRKPLPAAVPVSATGWGVTGSSASANTMNAVLLRVDLQMMPNQVCQQRPDYGPLKIKEGVFCAANPKQSTCRGDSGGPVILTNGTPLLVGIVSWGKLVCAGDGSPGVFTRIDHYAQWIDQAMKLPPGKNRLP